MALKIDMVSLVIVEHHPAESNSNDGIVEIVVKTPLLKSILDPNSPLASKGFDRIKNVKNSIFHSILLIC